MFDPPSQENYTYPNSTHENSTQVLIISTVDNPESVGPPIDAPVIPYEEPTPTQSGSSPDTPIIDEEPSVYIGKAKVKRQYMNKFNFSLSKFGEILNSLGRKSKFIGQRLPSLPIPPSKKYIDPKKSSSDEIDDSEAYE